MKRSSFLCWVLPFTLIQYMLLFSSYLLSSEEKPLAQILAELKENKNPNPQRLIFLLGMGSDVAHGNLVERCVFSIRTRGEYKGPIMLLTDAPEGRFQQLQEEYGLTVVAPLQEHWDIQYHDKAIPVKRFKTFMLDYVDMQPQFDSVKLVYYLDIDIVAGNNLNHFFRKIEQQHKVNVPTPASEIFIFWYHTPQSGQMILKRGGSDDTQRCLSLWRDEFHKAREMRMDQDALLNLVNLLNNYPREHQGKPAPCNIVTMKPEQYVLKITPWYMVWLEISGRYHAPLLHFHNTYTKKKTISQTMERDIVRKVLGAWMDQTTLSFDKIGFWADNNAVSSISLIT